MQNFGGANANLCTKFDVKLGLKVLTVIVT